MNTVGIIAEYNPFHNGHKYQIKYARNVLHADRVIVAMSGCFTQRGTPALLDPWTRVRMALLNGADLVLLIPVIGSCASSREYARAGAALLEATGIVDTLLFGAEDPDQELFEAAVASRPSENDPLLKEYLSKGESFASARAAVLETSMLHFLNRPNNISQIANADQTVNISYERNPASGKHNRQNTTCARERIHAFLASPNNILGIEYTAAIQDLKLSLKPIPMQRKVSSHRDKEIKANYASSGAIRHYIAQEPNMKHSYHIMPENTSKILQDSLHRNEYVLPDDFSLLYASSLLGHTDYTQFFDCNEDFSRRIKASLDSYTNISDFCENVLKSKNMTLSRVWRIITHILLGITDDLMEEYKSVSYAPYLYVAGVRKESRQLLSEISRNGSAPLITSPTDLMQSNKMLHKRKNAYKSSKTTDEVERNQSPVEPEAGNIESIRQDILSCDLHAEALYRMVLNNKSQNMHPTPYTRRLQII